MRIKDDREPNAAKKKKKGTQGPIIFYSLKHNLFLKEHFDKYCITL